MKQTVEEAAKKARMASAETLTTYAHRSLDDFTYLSHDEIAAAAIPIAGAILGATYGYQNNLKKQRNKIEDAAGDRVAGIIKGKKKKE